MKVQRLFRKEVHSSEWKYKTILMKYKFKNKGKSMGAFIDLTGQYFERLYVIKRGPNKKHSTQWFCRCECGTEKLVLT